MSTNSSYDITIFAPGLVPGVQRLLHYSAMTTNTGFNLTMRCTSQFVDRPFMKRLIKDCGLQALPKIGAFVRRRARSLLRRRKRVSTPGEPPSVHSTDDVATLKNILFVVEPAASRVLIGPVKLNQVNRMADTGSQSVPQIMEFGGTVAIQEVSSNKGITWRRMRANHAKRPSELVRTRRATYAPRPFLGPALAAEVAAGTIPQTLSGTVRAA